MWCQFAVIPFLLIYLCFKKTEGNSLISQLPGNPALGASFFFFSRSSSSSSSSSLNLVGSLIFCCWLGDNMNVHTRNRITLMGLGTARSGLTTQKSRSCCDLSHPKNWNLKIQSIEKENHLVKTSIFEFHVNFQGYNDCIMIPIIHISSWSHGEQWQPLTSISSRNPTVTPRRLEPIHTLFLTEVSRRFLGMRAYMPNYPPRKIHSTWKWMVGRLVSFW